jgi:DNA-binding CsgD family transcriptional regulator
LTIESDGRPLVLSERERRVLTELASGKSTEGAAASMCISPHTVRSHVKSALRKLGAQTRSHGIAIAIAEGAIDVERLRSTRRA